MANVSEYQASSTTSTGVGSIVSTIPVVMATVVMALVISMVGGDKALRPFLWLVLLSMLVVNAGSISEKLNSFKGVIAP